MSTTTRNRNLVYKVRREGSVWMGIIELRQASGQTSRLHLSRHQTPASVTEWFAAKAAEEDSALRAATGEV